MAEKLFYVGVKGLITNSNSEVLLLKTGPRYFIDETAEYWDIPGGRIQTGDTVEQTLRREVDEETGLKVAGQPVFFTAVISNKDVREDGKIIGLVLMIYKVEVEKTGPITMSGEHTTYEWVKPTIAAKRLAYKYPLEFTNLVTKL